MPPSLYPDGGSAVTMQDTWGGGPSRRNSTKNLVLGGIGLSRRPRSLALLWVG